MGRNITIHQDGKPIYEIVIRDGFEDLTESFQKLNVAGRKICIVTDSNVGPLYADAVEKALEKTGNHIFLYTFSSGEENKTLQTVQDVYEYLIRNRFDRGDYLAALGGGVVGDLTGYAAATYLRGISFIQIPTTLLAQTDSSIGGKTGVDFRAYKNMVGAFHQPGLVYMNMSTLKTLDRRQFFSGFGEILKHGLIKDRAYLEWLLAHFEAIEALEAGILEEMIYQSCLIKKAVVEADPMEKGERALLNFGHTLGHAIEKSMNFTLYHGECVVLGMIAALRLSAARGLISAKDVADVKKAFERCGFPMTACGLEPRQILTVSKSDKKMDGGKIKFILLKGLGCAYIDRTVSDEEILACLEDVLKS